MKTFLILFFVGVCACFGQLTKADRILQSAEEAKNALKNAIQKFDSDDMLTFSEGFFLAESDLDLISRIQGEARNFLKTRKRNRNYYPLAGAKMDRLTTFLREKFCAEKQKMRSAKKRIEKYGKDRKLRNKNPSFLFDQKSP